MARREEVTQDDLTVLPSQWQLAGQTGVGAAAREYDRWVGSVQHFPCPFFQLNFAFLMASWDSSDRISAWSPSHAGSKGSFYYFTDNQH
jgi:hypothetical protein